jgi:hypothetical protein
MPRTTKTKPAPAARAETPRSTYILRDIDDNLWRRVKAKAAMQGVTLKEAVNSMLVQYVEAR